MTQNQFDRAPGQIQDNLYHINTIEYYLAIESNKLLMPTTIWANLNCIMFNETKGEH